jgi:type I restriction enzyme S subunit
VRQQQASFSSISWFDVLPNGWAVERLKQVIGSVSSGVSVNASNVPAEANQYGVLKTSAISGGKFYPRENKAVWESELDRLDCPVTGDSLIISRMNTPSLVGESGYVGVSHPNLFLPDRLWQLIFNPERVFTPYISYALSSPGAREALSSMATGTSPSMKNLSIEDLGSLPIPLPSIGEQKIISAFLQSETSRVDCLIAKKERMLDLLDEKRSALISCVATHGLDANAPLKPSGLEWLGEIPAHWEIQPIKYLAEVGNGSTPSVENADYWDEGGFPWLNSSVVNVSPVTSASRYVTEIALRECHLPKIHPPAVLVGITGQGKTRGMAALLGMEATINQHLAFIKPRSQEIGTEYLYYLLGHAYAFLRSDSDAAGSTKGAITCEQLASMKIPVPPIDEQIDICARIEKSLVVSIPLRSKITRSLDLLAERRSSLITAAVTGQIAMEEMAQ